jgi:hypothetical protein
MRAFIPPSPLMKTSSGTVVCKRRVYPTPAMRTKAAREGSTLHLPELFLSAVPGWFIEKAKP